MLTTVPPIIYLFVALSGPVTSYPTHKVIYETDNKQACFAQAKVWNEVIQPLKPMFFCFEHMQLRLHRPGSNDD